MKTKKKITRFYYSNKALDLIRKIIKSENLKDLKFEIKDTTLGDTVIEVSGETEDVIILEQIYEMVR